MKKLNSNYATYTNYAPIIALYFWVNILSDVQSENFIFTVIYFIPILPQSDCNQPKSQNRKNLFYRAIHAYYWFDQVHLRAP